MQQRLQTILLDEQDTDKSDEAMIQMDQDLRMQLPAQRWDDVQRLLNTVPEGTFIPVGGTYCDVLPLWHLAVDIEAYLTNGMSFRRVRP